MIIVGEPKLLKFENALLMVDSRQFGTEFSSNSVPNSNVISYLSPPSQLEVSELTRKEEYTHSLKRPSPSKLAILQKYIFPTSNAILWGIEKEPEAD